MKDMEDIDEHGAMQDIKEHRISEDLDEEVITNIFEKYDRDWNQENDEAEAR